MREQDGSKTEWGGTRDPICPYCDACYQDVNNQIDKADEVSTDVKCENCGKAYKVTSRVAFVTEKIESPLVRTFAEEKEFEEAVANLVDKYGVFEVLKDIHSHMDCRAESDYSPPHARLATKQVQMAIDTYNLVDQ